MMEKQITWNNKTVHYAISGAGPAVILLHGYLEDHHIWEPLIRILEKKFLVITPDLPGFGQTSVFGECHSMSFMADAVKAILDEEKITRIVLSGHSMGGYVGLAFADHYEDYLNGFILFHSHAAGDSNAAIQNRMRTVEIVKQGHKNYIAKFIPDLFAEENKTRYSKEIEQLCKTASGLDALGITAALKGMATRKDYRNLLGKLSVPVLFIVGKKDSRISIEIITDQIRVPAHAEVVLLENVGHMGFVEAPDTVFPVIKSFCERTSYKSSYNEK